MKKKLIATMVAGAVLSTGLIALTACGGGLSINKGEEVDAEGWTKAFAATIDAKNFTVEAYQEESINIKGSGELLKLLLGQDSVDLTAKSTRQGKTAYDIENGTYYGDASMKVTASGVPDAWKDEYKEQDAKTSSCAIKDGDTIYVAYYNSDSKEENKWNVSTTDVISNGLSYILGDTYATEKNGSKTSLSALYDAFSYGGGVYTATLWQGSTELKVSVSVKGGYIVGYSYEASYDEEEGGMKTTGTEKSVYNFSNYGGTTVKVSDDAKKAVEDYKAE